MKKQQFIAEKMKILVGRENYTPAQAYKIAESLFEEDSNVAQQGQYNFNRPTPNFSFTPPNINQLPSQEYDFSYNGFNPQPVENNTSFGQPSTFSSSYVLPEQPSFTPNPQEGFFVFNQAQNQEHVVSQAQNPYT